MSTEPRKPVHGEMFCEHCDNYVLLCSHGCGIDWHKLCLEAEQKLALAVEAAKLGLSFAPRGPVPKDLAPMFYHTLNYSDEVKLQERIDKAREALALINPDAQKEGKP